MTAVNRARRARTALFLAALAALATAGVGPGARAQTPDMVFAVGRFVADMSVAGPACGKRDKVWAVRLAYKYRAALSALSPQLAAQLPDRTVESAWNAALYEMDQARAALRADQAGYCGETMTGERLYHADALADGKAAFW